MPDDPKPWEIPVQYNDPPEDEEMDIPSTEDTDDSEDVGGPEPNNFGTEEEAEQEEF